MYLIGGVDETNAVVDTVTIFDTTTNTYATGPKMTAPRARFAVATVSTHV